MPAPVAAAAAAPAAGSILAWAQANPFMANILANVGFGVLNQIQGPSAFEQQAQQQAGIGKTLIPQLQRQAQGLPTPQTQNIQRQLRQQTTSAQQSYAAGATARGGGGTPVAAQQARFGAAETQALGSLLGQQATAAQQQLTGLYSQGTQQLYQAQQYGDKRMDQGVAGIMDYIGWSKNQGATNQGATDPNIARLDDLIRRVIDLNLAQQGGQMPLGPAYGRR